MTQRHELSVRLHGQPVGTLRLHSGSMQFAYLEDARRPISLSMPIKDEPYKNKACEAFFGGLLPDDPDKKKIIARLFGINSNSNFSLLEKIGFDCAGAISVLDTEEPTIIDEFQPTKGSPLSEQELHGYLKELPAKPLLASMDGLRISLAGAQEKAALCRINGVLNVPRPTTPTTHILKPRIGALKQSVANEYFCMSLAKSIALNTANVEYAQAKDIEYLLIERYDREYTESGHIRRIHQEDFCQALGIVSTKKYEADGGPSLPDCFKLLDRFSYPGIDKIELLKRVLFNFIIGNADCHAKNFSVLHYEGGGTKLSPAYDLLCTVVYSQHTTRSAMAIGGESDLNAVRGRNWEKFCKHTNILPAALKRTARDLAKRIRSALPELTNQLPENIPLDTIREIDALIEHRMWLMDATLNEMS